MLPSLSPFTLLLVSQALYFRCAAPVNVSGKRHAFSSKKTPRNFCRFRPNKASLNKFVLVIASHYINKKMKISISTYNRKCVCLNSAGFYIFLAAGIFQLIADYIWVMWDWPSRSTVYGLYYLMRWSMAVYVRSKYIYCARVSIAQL